MLKYKNYYIVWLLGAMSGFTIMLSSSSLNFWLAKSNIDLRTIGAFALISLPYAINFLWAPIFDLAKAPLIGRLFSRRVAWVILMQFALAIIVYIIGLLNPVSNLTMIAAAGFGIAIFASAQDTLLGTIRTELVDCQEQGAISGFYIFGYRVGMLISGSGAIFISRYIGWNLVYKYSSLVILGFILLMVLLDKYLLHEPVLQMPHKSIKLLASKGKLLILMQKIIAPFNLYTLILIISFLILYRLPDNFISVMISPFLLHVGYDEFAIATAGKFLGVSGAIIGGLLASRIMIKVEIYRSLMFFGIIHALAHILFIFQEIYGQNIFLLFTVVGFESVSGGMAMAAYIAYIASLCQGRFRATQYSFFSSMMGLSRSILPAGSGYLVTHFGWINFYLFTTIATIPALILLLFLPKLTKQFFSGAADD